MRIERRVGQGSFGEVYCAQLKAAEEKIALKKLRISNSSIGIPAAFLRELLIQQTISSQYAVSYKGVFFCKQEGVFPFLIATEFIDNDLYKFLKQREALSNEQTQKILREISFGLRDLKH